jgi:hypothetical protein
MPPDPAPIPMPNPDAPVTVVALEGDEPRPIYVDLAGRLRAFDPGGVEVIDVGAWETWLPPGLEARPGEVLDEDLEPQVLRLRERYGRRLKAVRLRTRDGRRLVGYQQEIRLDPEKAPEVVYLPHPQSPHLPAFREILDPAGVAPGTDGVDGATPPGADGAGPQITIGDLLKQLPDPGSHPALGRLEAIGRAEGRRQFGSGTVRLLRDHVQRLLWQAYRMTGVDTDYVDRLTIEEAASVLEAAARREDGRIWNPTPETCQNCQGDLDIWTRAQGRPSCHGCRTGRRASSLGGGNLSSGDATTLQGPPLEHVEAPALPAPLAAPAPVPSQDPRGVVGGGKFSARIVKDKHTEDRDSFIYSRCCTGATCTSIIRQVKENKVVSEDG